MKTTFTSVLFAGALFSVLMYSCQKEETVRITPPNKTTTTVASTVPDNNTTGTPSPTKPIDNPSNPNTNPNTPANPNHPPIDPGVNVSNAASCRNCHVRVESAGGELWQSTGSFTNTVSNPTNAGHTSGKRSAVGE